MRYCNGQRVECIKGHDEQWYKGVNVPRVGELYFVRAIDGSGGLLLREIVNDKRDCFDLGKDESVTSEPSFQPDHFRPLFDFFAAEKLN